MREAPCLFPEGSPSQSAALLSSSGVWLSRQKSLRLFPWVFPRGNDWLSCNPVSGSRQPHHVDIPAALLRYLAGRINARHLAVYHDFLAVWFECYFIAYASAHCWILADLSLFVHFSMTRAAWFFLDSPLWLLLSWYFFSVYAFQNPCLTYHLEYFKFHSTILDFVRYIFSFESEFVCIICKMIYNLTCR